MCLKSLLSILLIFIGQLLVAQNNQQDVVYLKNGTIVRGFISEFQPDKNVTIKTAEQSIFVFEMSEVEKITREPGGKQYHIKQKGYFNETAMVIGVGGDKNDRNTSLSLITVNGYQVNRFFRIGGGAGVMHYADYDNTFYPLFGRVSGDMIKFRITPVYFADAGYAFFLGKDTYQDGMEEVSSKGGFMLHTGAGIKFYTVHKASFTLTAGFSLQKSEREYQYIWWSEGSSYKEKRDYRRVTFGLGINF